jgi:hypothetical protein
MLITIALLSTALATPESVEKATRLHLEGHSTEAAELLLPQIDDDPAAALALGRIFFANSQWALAEAAYHQVPRDSGLWFRSRLEATWAAYYLDPTHERAIARALLLYAEDPKDRELRYLMGLLVLHCGGEGGGGPGRVGDLTSGMLAALIAELETEVGQATPQQSSDSPKDLGTMSQVVHYEFIKTYDHGMYQFQPRCGWDSLGVEPQRFAFEQDSSVTRAILLTLSGELDPSNRPSDGCSLHGTGLIPPGQPRAGSPRCPDSTADRKLDHEASRWLGAYRQDLD